MPSRSRRQPQKGPLAGVCLRSGYALPPADPGASTLIDAPDHPDCRRTLCVLSELQERLEAGDVWVFGSRRYRSFKEGLISADAFEEVQRSDTLPIDLAPDFETFIAGRQHMLEERLRAMHAKAAVGMLPEVTINNSVLKVAPIARCGNPARRWPAR